jgi:hypothetical protein
MVAPLAPKERIPELADMVDTPAKLRLLRHLERSGFIFNGDDLDTAERAILELFSDVLVDAAYADGALDKPQSWVISPNGSRVLAYIEAELPRLLAEFEEKDAEERAKRGRWA